MSGSVDALIAERKQLWERIREIDALIAKVAFEEMASPMPANAVPSGRQREVLGLLFAGMANKEIAGALHISERTVKFHVSNLLRIFGAKGRIDLVRMAAAAS
jgi:DNA-binding NarL/FixJ family response regulator